MSLQHTFAAQKASGTLGCIKSSMGSRAKEIILPLYSSLMRPHLQCCVQLWATLNKKEMDLFEQVQRIATKMTERLEHLSYNSHTKKGWES